MVSKTIDIHNQTTELLDDADGRLIVEVSPTSFSVLLCNKAKNELLAVEVFNGNMANAEDRKLIIEQSNLLTNSNLDVIVVSAFGDVLPMPLPFYTPQNACAQMGLLFGQSNTSFAGKDVLEAENMVVNWRMPAALYHFLANKFKQLQVKHLASEIIKKNNIHEGCIGKIVIYNNLTWIFLWENGVFLIVKSIDSTVPEDLSYNLLNICKQLDINIGEVK